MKTLFLLCVFLIGMLPAFSQGRDTAFAVHKLFKQRRGRANGWMGAGADAAVDESVGWRAIRSTSDNMASAAFYGGIPMILGFTQAQRFSSEREQNILQRYAEGLAIPADIRRRLRRRHFHRTARDLEPIARP